jgi:hypothetical protein
MLQERPRPLPADIAKAVNASGNWSPTACSSLVMKMMQACAALFKHIVRRFPNSNSVQKNKQTREMNHIGLCISIHIILKIGA